jgi:iron uptake system EfeUOB component EfeO/EfeM
MLVLAALGLACTGAALSPLGASAAADVAHGHLKQVIPVNPAQLFAPLAQYRTFTRAQLGDISTELPTLLGAEQAGDMSAARAAWLAPHLHWLEIGQDDGAYGAFGALGRSIDGTAAGYRGGVHNADFTGFHRIEYELWTADDISAAAAQTVTLENLIAKLRRIGMAKELPRSATALQNWVLRAHEILEDADRDTLTGDDDYGSATGVASVTADASATDEMLKLLEPVIEPRAPKLTARGEGDIARIQRVAKTTEVNGQWVAVAQLPQLQREQLDAAVGEALENLAPISDIIHVDGAQL